MLTPAEEFGLSGMSLASSVRAVFHRLSPERQFALYQNLQSECGRRHVVYMRDEKVETIRLLPCPITALPDQLGYLHYVSNALHNALRRLPDLYFQNAAAREALRLPEAEEAWLRDAWTAGARESNPVFGRLDAVIDFSSPMWKETLRFVEPNMSGIGGLHLAPTCERIMQDVVFPILREFDPRLDLSIGQDIRELLMQEMLDHAELVGYSVRTIGFVEPRFATSGIDEQEDLAKFYHDRYGLRVVHADPTELEIRGDRVCYQGMELDLVYRDYPVLDLLELQRSGRDVEPMRRLFMENRMVSSIAAELDQKSCFEIFTDPQYASFFSAEERQIFRRHVLWTRIVSDRQTELPDGRKRSLLDFARAERETLVLKPNRSFGGQGVLLGLATEAAVWEQTLEKAMHDTDRWVIQKLAPIPVHEFPVITEQNDVRMEPFHVVMGFAPSKYGIAILARASQKQVVNVAQRGGMCSIAVGHPPSRLVGPP